MKKKQKIFFLKNTNPTFLKVNEIISYQVVLQRKIGYRELVKNTFDYLIFSNDTFPCTVW